MPPSPSDVRQRVSVLTKAVEARDAMAGLIRRVEDMPLNTQMNLIVSASMLSEPHRSTVTVHFEAPRYPLPRGGFEVIRFDTFADGVAAYMEKHANDIVAFAAGYAKAKAEVVIDCNQNVVRDLGAIVSGAAQE